MEKKKIQSALFSPPGRWTGNGFLFKGGLRSLGALRNSVRTRSAHGILRALLLPLVAYTLEARIAYNPGHRNLGIQSRADSTLYIRRI